MIIVWYTNLFDTRIWIDVYLYGEHVIMKFEELSCQQSYTRWISWPSKRNNTVWNGSIYRISILLIGRILKGTDEGNHETPSWSNCRYRCNEMSRLTKQGYYTNHPWWNSSGLSELELFSLVDREFSFPLIFVT